MLGHLTDSQGILLDKESLRICPTITRSISPRQINRKPAIVNGVVFLNTTPFTITDFRRFRAGQILRVIVGQILSTIMSEEEYSPLLPMPF